ncbi:carboxypeptidase-like regulatory domain-containing protein [Corallococcus carmarthensis]|uniref:Carboxypeptidase regulatory-like domain-containing protein n=1 Tax=Corallococcus carmarthensis TaxID=2316728 RepID=A0A3A8JQE8_9BACT|nr:carboxypeptidase-like regulatory domain-containing protein [Corallococcus carmarthensis]NOK20991.1 carboxypeptidase regulatory-like domain-containing protein [Corallococcus carmarthensis]RKG98032.1 carboxypeptidase regulatory-like domain-containing protein [Corallococcus carmarthensis]
MRAKACGWVLVLAMAGCGGFDNSSLQTGTVRGRILGVEADVARVSVMGRTDLRASVASDGSFQLDGVPATSLELFVVASRTRAARKPVVAQGARVTDVGDIASAPGAFLTVRVMDERGAIPSGIEVEVKGTGLDRIKADASNGEARLGPLPVGCYELEVKADDLEDVEEEICVREGEQLVRDITLPADDDGGGGDDDGGDDHGGGKDGG